MSVENLVGCRKALAGAFASAVMIAMSTSGAMAVVGCAGAADGWHPRARSPRLAQVGQVGSDQGAAARAGIRQATAQYA